MQYDILHTKDILSLWAFKYAFVWAIIISTSAFFDHEIAILHMILNVISIWNGKRQAIFTISVNHVIEFSYMVHSFYFSRVSIIRGRVVTLSGQGIIGVRVSVDRTKDSTNYGFTLTRPGGW